MSSVDLLIVGGGPAGVSAAIEASARGLSVLLLDENPAPGGRIWQALERRDPMDADEEAARGVLQAFRDCGAQAQFGATVWAIEPDGQVFWSVDGASHSTIPARILIATGTTERPMPIPGWTLPGVMTVGAAQIALKTAGVVPRGATWIAGQGPLLLLYAVQALRHGGDIAGILDLSDPARKLRAVGHLPAAAWAAADLVKGVQWRRAIAKAGIPWLRVSAVRAEGDTELERIVMTAHGRERVEAAETLLLHDGVMPSVQLTRALGCAHTWSEVQRCWRPQVDAVGLSSVPHVYVAGDGAGIGGARAAALSGRIAALAIACDLGRLDEKARNTAARPLLIQRRRALALRPLLDALYAPRRATIADETIVCRCEEVAAGEIRQAVQFGCLGANQLKAYTRCGMGPCQGRTCGTLAAEVIAQARSLPVSQIDPLRPRFPTKPLRLSELMDVQED
jgi:NADPH-dependent 2,4-dienoyl-CoA reductase/sulfur reductase-like enzyme